MTARHIRAAIALATVAALTAAVLVAGPGYETSQVRMRSGAVWLASSQTGEVALVDGVSAEVKAHLPVAAAGAALTVTQQDGAAFVLNRATGGLSRVDSATERLSPPVSVLPPSDGLVMLPAPDGLYVADVHSGAIVPVDTASLTPRGEPERLANVLRPDSAVVDGRGRVWAIDDATGDLVWFDDDARRARTTATENGRLAVVQGQAVLVDPGRGTAESLSPESGAVARSVQLDLDAGDLVVTSGSAGRSRLLIANRTRGELIACAFDTGSCADPMKIASAGAELGAPVEAGDYAVVPDHSTGQATIVDLAGSRVVAQRGLFDRPTPFDLVSRDGIVFFNDPNGNTAGVLDLTGQVRTITKHTESPAADDVPPAPGRPAPADQVAKVDRPKEHTGLELPDQTGRPSVPDSVPHSEASIVVRPGTRGVVGDKFELTLVLQPAGDATTTWSFGDGTGASGSSVWHTWNGPGTFTVRATATFGAGEQVRAETSVTVAPPETPPRITALTVQRPKPVIGESVRFSAGTNRRPDRWEWIVTGPDGPAPVVTAATAEFDHAFTATGRYTVSLTITAGSRSARSSTQFTVGLGAVKAWGNGLAGRLKVPEAASSGVVAIEAGDRQALALKADGSVIGWGSDYWDWLKVPAEASSGVVAISSRGLHSLALKANGAVIAWGSNSHGQTNVPEAATGGVVAIAAGESHSMALRSDGSVIAWGDPADGRVAVPEAATSGVVAIAAGYYMSLAVRNDGSIVVWGNNDGRQTEVPPEAIGGVRAVNAGRVFCLALKKDGSIVGWGTAFIMRPIPAAARTGVAAMDFSNAHALALKEDGTAFGWGGGNNAFGQATVPPEYSRGVLAVSAGNNYSMVVMG